MHWSSYVLAHLYSWDNDCHLIEDLFVVKHCHISIIHLSQFFGLFNNESFLVFDILFYFFEQKIGCLLLLSPYSLKRIQKLVYIFWFVDLNFHLLALFKNVPKKIKIWEKSLQESSLCFFAPLNLVGVWQVEGLLFFVEIQEMSQIKGS